MSLIDHDDTKAVELTVDDHVDETTIGGHEEGIEAIGVLVFAVAVTDIKTFTDGGAHEGSPQVFGDLGRGDDAWLSNKDLTVTDEKVGGDAFRGKDQPIRKGGRFTGAGTTDNDDHLMFGVFEPVVDLDDLILGDTELGFIELRRFFRPKRNRGIG